MPPPKSPRSEARRRQASKPTPEEHRSSEDDDSYISKDEDRSFTDQNDSRSYPRGKASDCSSLNVSTHSALASPRPDLSHHSDLNSSSDAHRHASRLHTSTTSSEADSPARHTRKSSPSYPLLHESKLYPSLDKFKSMDIGDECYKPTGTEAKASSSNETYFLLIIFICCVLVGLIYYMTSGASVKEADSGLSPFQRFTGCVSSLEEVMPNQSKRLWRTIKAASRHVLNDTKSDYPAVILMAFPPKNAHISKCIAEKIAADFEQSLGLNPGRSITDVSDIRGLDPPSQKKKLDEFLHTAFSHHQRKAFVIENIQLLQPEASLILHGYCDNDNAPHKDVMMVLLLNIDEHQISDYSSASVENYLEWLWSRGLDIDKVKALLSRVANNIVTVESEDNETFKKVCS